MTTEETERESVNVVPLNRHSSSEPARPTDADTDTGVQPSKKVVQDNRHSSSEPAD